MTQDSEEIGDLWSMYQEPILLEITKSYAVKCQASLPGIDLIQFQSSKHQYV